MAESMSTEDSATTNCDNCKKDIPQHNFEMHNLHCHRNVRLCKKCEEPVPISEMEDHNEEYHAVVECKCKIWIEKAKLEEHEKKFCNQRTVHCQYCEIDMKYCEIDAHENACGSRTEKCQDCSEFVMLKNTLRHECGSASSVEANRVKNQKKYTDNSSSSSHGFGGYNGYTQDMFGGLSNRFNDTIPDDVTRFLGETVSRNVGRNRAAVADKGSFVGKLNNDDGFANNFQDLGIDDRAGARGGADTRVKKRSAARNAMQHSTVSDGKSSAHDRQKPLRKIVGTERRSRFEAKHPKVVTSDSREARSTVPVETDFNEAPSTSWDERYHERIKKAMDEREAQAKVVAQNELTPQPLPTNHGFELPCEICEKLFPLDQLEVHQESCLIAQHEAFRSMNFDPVPAKPTPEEVIVVDDDDGDSGEISFIPCEFCGEKFPADNVIMHQPYCDVNPLRHWPPPSDQEEAAKQRLDEFSTDFQTRQREIFEQHALFNDTGDASGQQFGRGFGALSLMGMHDGETHGPNVLSDDEDMLPARYPRHERK